jgi:uncharacterized membrane protein YfcA
VAVAVALALATLVGLALGLLGGGGSILTVPIFVYALGFGAKEAIAMSLAVVGATSLVGAIGHWQAGHVNGRVAVVFGGIAMIGTYLGARLAAHVSDEAQLALFAVVMLVAAYFMVRDAGRTTTARKSPEPLGKLTPYGLLLVEGLLVGVVTGLVGVGGGFLIVPTLVLLAQVPMKEAIGTSLLIIALKSATGFLGYWGQVEVQWGFMAAFTVAAVVGVLAGTGLVRFVAQQTLRRAFAGFLVLVGVFILYQNGVAALPG